MNHSAHMFGLGAAELLVVLAIAIPIFLVIASIPAILAFVCLRRVPAEFRKQNPALCFLLLIPLFSLIWAFFVHPRVAESIKAYNESRGDSSGGDCGGKLALWLCITPILSFIPLLGILAGLACLILLIMFYVKAFDLTSKFPAA